MNKLVGLTIFGFIVFLAELYIGDSKYILAFVAFVVGWLSALSYATYTVRKLL